MAPTVSRDGRVLELRGLQEARGLPFCNFGQMAFIEWKRLAPTAIMESRCHRVAPWLSILGSHTWTSAHLVNGLAPSNERGSVWEPGDVT
jgi:hypothetical protein